VAYSCLINLQTLSDSARVRLIVETIDNDGEVYRQQSWAVLERLWNDSSFNSGGERQFREQLHKRH
jgi:hypothetical protein